MIKYVSRVCIGTSQMPAGLGCKEANPKIFVVMIYDEYPCIWEAPDIRVMFGCPVQYGALYVGYPKTDQNSESPRITHTHAQLMLD